jgi:hypothetical protein
LVERRNYLNKNGYLNYEVERGLEEIYAATVKLVLSEKILGDFHNNAAEY